MNYAAAAGVLEFGMRAADSAIQHIHPYTGAVAPVTLICTIQRQVALVNPVKAPLYRCGNEIMLGCYTLNKWV